MLNLLNQRCLLFPQNIHSLFIRIFLHILSFSHKFGDGQLRWNTGQLQGCMPVISAVWKRGQEDEELHRNQPGLAEPHLTLIDGGRAQPTWVVPFLSKWIWVYIRKQAEQAVGSKPVSILTPFWLLGSCLELLPCLPSAMALTREL